MNIVQYSKCLCHAKRSSEAIAPKSTYPSCATTNRLGVRIIFTLSIGLLIKRLISNDINMKLIVKKDC